MKIAKVSFPLHLGGEQPKKAANGFGHVCSVGREHALGTALSS